MDVHHDFISGIPKSEHCQSQQIPRRGLNNVFHQFRAVGFDTHPLFAFANALVGKALSAEAVLGHLGLDVGKVSAGR